VRAGLQTCRRPARDQSQSELSAPPPCLVPKKSPGPPSSGGGGGGLVLRFQTPVPCLGHISGDALGSCARPGDLATGINQKAVGYACAPVLPGPHSDAAVFMDLNRFAACSTIITPAFAQFDADSITVGLDQPGCHFAGSEAFITRALHPASSVGEACPAVRRKNFVLQVERPAVGLRRFDLDLLSRLLDERIPDVGLAPGIEHPPSPAPKLSSARFKAWRGP